MMKKLFIAVLMLVAFNAALAQEGSTTPIESEKNKISQELELSFGGGYYDIATKVAYHLPKGEFYAPKVLAIFNIGGLTVEGNKYTVYGHLVGLSEEIPLTERFGYMIEMQAGYNRVVKSHSPYNEEEVADANAFALKVSSGLSFKLLPKLDISLRFGYSAWFADGYLHYEESKKTTDGLYGSISVRYVF